MKILIDNGHGNDTPGKCSPDKSFREYAYAREIAKRVVSELKEKGYDVERIVTEDNDISLKERVKRTNDICKKLGASNVLFISIHCNAAGNGSWMNAQGWSAFTSKGKTKSDKLADCFYKHAEKNFKGRKIRTDYSDKDPDWESNFYVLKNTNCPAILTENFFMDNKKDLEYLLTQEGKDAIVKTHVDGIIEYLKK